MNNFPAVLIGGPPHSGKSVLTFSLSIALRKQGLSHYVLRACPDGEGDWANQTDQTVVRTIRVKGEWTGHWIDHICRDIQNRHLPLLVDVGGKPTPDQERIFDYCTDAVLLTVTAQDEVAWRQTMQRHGVPVLAELTSRLGGTGAVETVSPVVRGQISNLVRGSEAAGPAFAALVDRLSVLLDTDSDALRQRHLELAPVELAIDLDRLVRVLNGMTTDQQTPWEPRHLRALADYLPSGTALAFYGRGPNWLYAAGACLASPAPFHLFDVRLGWVEARPLSQGPAPHDSPVRFSQANDSEVTFIDCQLNSSYLEHEALDVLVAPPVDCEMGVVLSGRLPHWLSASLAMTYCNAQWVSVYQPQLGSHSVTVHSKGGQGRPQLGDTVLMKRPASGIS